MGTRDESALSAFYDATLNRAFGVAVRILNDESLAEDVVADVYHDVWNKAADYDEKRGRPITWLLTICRNRALDEYRRRATRQKTAETVAREDQAETHGPDDILAVVDENHALHDALSAIKFDQRQLLALAFFRGLSHQEIADYTRTPLGTVKSSIRRALKALGETPGLQEMSRGG